MSVITNGLVFATEFPANPTINDEVMMHGSVYTWTGLIWREGRSVAQTFLEGGGGIGVSGTGEVSDPYVISSTGGGGGGTFSESPEISILASGFDSVTLPSDTVYRVMPLTGATSTETAGGMTITSNKVYVPEDGLYDIGYSVWYLTSAATGTIAAITKCTINGSQFYPLTASIQDKSPTTGAGNGYSFNCSATVRLKAGDLIGFESHQNSGGSPMTVNANIVGLSIQRVGTPASLSTANWTVNQDGLNLVFSYDGVRKMKLEPSGKLTCVGDVVAFGSV